jgi:uracil-DNA glycosylase
VSTSTPEQRTSDAQQQRKALLDEQIRSCGKCGVHMNVKGVTQAAPGFGSVRSPVVIVGQSLCGGPCMQREEPFVGGCGKLLDTSFDRAKIDKADLFITNVVHCHPPRNRKSLPEWIENCTPYLHTELRIVQPSLVIGLGKDAEAALRDFYPHASELSWPFRTPRAVASHAKLRVHYLKHPSWIKRQHDDALGRQYVASLARALRWGTRR